MLLLDAALFPATVSADSTDSITVDGVTLDAGAPYLANGASTTCADRPDSGGDAFYDAATGTLTLHNAVISGAASDTHNYGIYSESDITVALEGSSRITAGDAATSAFQWRGDSKGIFLNNAALTVSSSGSLTVRSGKGASSYGIYAQGVTIKGTVEVSITAGCADASAPGVCYSCAIFSGWEACSIYGGANVTAAGGTTESENAKSIGIHAWRAMTIDDSNVTAKGNTQAMNIAPTITNGTISAATPLPAGIPGLTAQVSAMRRAAGHSVFLITPFSTRSGRRRTAAAPIGCPIQG